MPWQVEVTQTGSKAETPLIDLSEFARPPLVLAGGVKAWSVAAMLKDAGMVVVGTSIGKASEEDRRKVIEKAGGNTPMIERWQAEDIDVLLRQGDIDIVLSGGSSQFLSLKAGVPWLEINHERSFPLTGYHGTLALLGAIDQSLSNSIWQQVSNPAPWDEPAR